MSKDQSGRRSAECDSCAAGLTSDHQTQRSRRIALQANDDEENRRNAGTGRCYVQGTERRRMMGSGRSEWRVSPSSCPAGDAGQTDLHLLYHAWHPNQDLQQELIAS